MKELIDNNQLEVRVYRRSFLHAKCYIFGTDEENAIGIIGSSNFTKQGLFGNLELNQFEDNNATVNLDQTLRAVRPVIEFEANLKLFNFGTDAIADIDLVDSFTTDAFSTKFVSV